MGEFEPDDSRNVTLGQPHNPIEPERTGPREGETRAKSAAKDKDERKDRWEDEEPAAPVRGRPGG